MQARCNHCGHQGEAETFPTETEQDGGDFERCPNCGDDDVELLSPRELARQHYDADTEALAPGEVLEVPEPVAWTTGAEDPPEDPETRGAVIEHYQRLRDANRGRPRPENRDPDRTVRVLELSARQRDFLLAAIRCYQYELRTGGVTGPYEEMRTCGGAHDGLDADEANDLAEKLNMTG